MGGYLGEINRVFESLVRRKEIPTPFYGVQLRLIVGTPSLGLKRIVKCSVRGT